MQLVVNGLLTTYDDRGSGSRTVVLVHGWADSHKTFGNLQTELSKTYRVVALDLPGFGGTDASMDTWDLDNFAAFIAAFLQKTAINKPFAFIAHSNGGAVAIRGLAREVIQAEKLVLLASSGIRNRDKARKQLFKAVAKAGKAVTFALPRSTRLKLRRKLYKVAGSDMLVAEHLQKTFKKTVGQDVQADAARLRLPTLLLYGSKDTDTPIIYGKLLQEAIAGSKLAIIKGAGHFLHHDQSDKVNQAIKEFLQS
jgi:pimeloyl-ACP methyl ester carboxylesterase